jgi:hypothetical protein
MQEQFFGLSIFEAKTLDRIGLASIYLKEKTMLLKTGFSL